MILCVSQSFNFTELPSWAMFIYVITWIFTIFCFYYLIKFLLKNELHDANNRRSKYCYRLTQFYKKLKVLSQEKWGMQPRVNLV